MPDSKYSEVTIFRIETLKNGFNAVRMSQGTYAASLIDVLRLLIKTLGWGQ